MRPCTGRTHVRHGCLGAQMGGSEIHRERAFPVLVRQLQIRLSGVDGRHVDENVEAPECADGLGHGAATVCRRAQIRLDQLSAPPELHDRVGRRFRLGPRFPVAERDIGSPGGERERDVGADPFAARDEHDAVVQLHQCS